MSVAETLKELETALLKAPVVTVNEEEHVEGSTYLQQYKAYRTITDAAGIITDVVRSHLLDALEARSLDRELRVLSVGCGDGSVDNVILTKVLASCPTARISYTGLDMKPHQCTECEERLQHLPIKKKFICGNFDKLDPSQLGTFDVIYLIHVHYYFQQLQCAVSKLRLLLCNEGRCVMIGGQSDHQNSLITRFWPHEGKGDFWTMDYVAKALEDMAIPYQLQDIRAKLNLSSCFKDGWNSDVSKLLLDFICGTRMSRYPDNIRKVCIAFLTAAVADGPEEFILPAHHQSVCFKAT